MKSRLSVLCLASVPFLAGCGMYRFSATRVDTLTHPTPTRAIDVRGSNGSISIVAADVNEVTIDASLKAYGFDQAAADAALENLTIALTEANGVLKIEPVTPDPFRGSVAFDITVPASLAAKAKSSNASIRVDGITASVDAETSNGRIVLQSVGGPIRAKSSNGSIAIDASAPTTVSVRTSNGKVQFAGTLVGVDNQLRSSNGSIGLELGGVAELTASTSNGSIRVDGTKIAKGQTVLVGDSSAMDETPAVVSVKTSNGSITVRSRPSDAASAELPDAV